MDKQKLLDGIQIASDHLDEAAEGEHEIAHLLGAVSHLNDVLAAIVYAVAEINDKLQANETRERLLDDVFSLDGDEDY